MVQDQLVGSEHRQDEDPFANEPEAKAMHGYFLQ